jgi:hypothetical protein
MYHPALHLFRSHKISLFNILIYVHVDDVILILLENKFCNFFVNKMADSGDNSKEHPWPYLRNMFELKHISADRKNLKFACLLCKPRQFEVAAYYNSPSNLRKHVQVCHTDSCLDH